MIPSFRLFSQKFPRLTSFATTSSVLGLGLGAAIYATNRIKDPVERQLALDNFLDVEGYKAAQARQRISEKTGGNPS